MGSGSMAALLSPPRAGSKRSVDEAGGAFADNDGSRPGSRRATEDGGLRDDELLDYDEEASAASAASAAAAAEEAMAAANEEAAV